MLIFQLVITLVLLGMSGILLSNWWTFPRLRGGAEVTTDDRRRTQHGTRNSQYADHSTEHIARNLHPRNHASALRLSCLIPARNEPAVIGETVRALLAQARPEMEVLLLNDHSTDGTAEVARAAAGDDPRLRILPGEELPPGWLGKNWACHQLAQAASGEILVFTDADVHWSAGAVDALLAEMEATGAHLLTVWPTQETVTWGERLTVPLMALVVHAYLPILCVHHTPYPLFAAANGQCMVFRRPAYSAVGGHASVRDNVLEDVTLARHIKEKGLRLRMIEGNGLVRCRMYRSWAEVRNGYAKNILKGYGNTVGLIAATLFHWAIFLGPWLAVLAIGPGVVGDAVTRPHGCAQPAKGERCSAYAPFCPPHDPHRRPSALVAVALWRTRVEREKGNA
jgi:glycosyltransferase involved in cell wall biosynthesis